MKLLEYKIYYYYYYRLRNSLDLINKNCKYL